LQRVKTAIDGTSRDFQSGTRPIDLGAAMQALDKPEKTHFEQFKDMQQRLRNHVRNM
jgi:hypothetical protein